MVNNKKVLILSYYACMPGACQAEWLDDKIDSLLKGGYEVALVSAICSRRHVSKTIHHWRVPSISYTDFKDELLRIKLDGARVQLRTLMIYPLVLTFGILFDASQYLLTKGVGEGRWSWTLPSTFSSLILALKFKPDIILTTGGPASAHLAGIAVSKLTGSPVVIELQDPLSGSDIGRNEQARGWLYRVERFIVATADKTVYVTKAAAVFAVNQFHSSKIHCVYPGAKNFSIIPSQLKSCSNGKFRLVHLGSLYATRNFRAIIDAIDILIDSGKLSEKEVELINMGHVAKEISEEILMKSYVKILPPVPREDALQFAADCDVTLLIQNTDERSKVTIPYKTYDYLNLGNSLLALLNSDELTELLAKYGHVAVPLSDTFAITQELEKMLARRSVIQKPNLLMDAVAQACHLLTLPRIKQTNQVVD